MPVVDLEALAVELHQRLRYRCPCGNTPTVLRYPSSLLKLPPAERDAPGTAPRAD